MCGIAGFIGFRDDNLIKKISKELEHRGPDGEGSFINENVSLLNRRLAIIDRKGGDQPIFNEDKTIAVVYNGEIYNYRELREELEKKGHKFKTQSDTEVIAHGYEEWGEGSFDKYNGMFAIALYDLKKKKLVLVRDHFGIKPLYYSLIDDVSGPVSQQPQNRPTSLASGGEGPHSGAPRLEPPETSNKRSLIFASEIKPIIFSGLVVKEPNDRIIYRYLMYRVHDDNEETFFKGVYKLMPGQMMVVDSSGFKVHSYSKLREELMNSRDRSRPVRTGNTVQEFKQKLVEAIRLRLISEVPVGTCLSGGLDSSTVVAVVNKLLKEKVNEAESVGKVQKTFSAVFPNSSNNEEVYIDSLTEKLKGSVKNYKVFPQPEKFFEELEDFVKTQEEPTISSGPYAQYKVMEEAHKYVTVLLDGQGSDEMMAGYLPYYFVYLRQLRLQNKYLQLIKEIIGARDVLSKYFFQKFKTRIFVQSILNKEFTDSFKNEKFVINNHNLKERLVDDIFHNSLPSLLRYEDKNTMHFSIEGRVPFLDFNLLRFIFNLDDKAIIENGWNKSILRQAVEEILPTEIVQRRNKIGFTTPEHEWFIRMKNRIYSVFLSEEFASRKYFNQPEVLKSFQKFIEGKFDDTMLFWRLLNLEMWLRIFFDTASAKTSARRVKQRSIFSPNPNKELTITVADKKYYRFPIKTDLFKSGDDVAKKVIKHVSSFLQQLFRKKQFEKLGSKEWFIVLSEKIVAISQGRSYFIWDINPGFLAKTLSKYVKKTPFGIGLGSPWTMELAIREVGVVRVVAASILGILGRLVGVRGLFYVVAGANVRAIDGPTEYSLYPSNVSAKLPPKNPNKVAKDLHKEVENYIQKSYLKNFQGVVIIDANDLGRNVLGNSTKYPNTVIEEIFKDNPMGQASEQTPLIIAFTF